MADEQCVASVIKKYPDELSIAAANGPANVVISGVADKLRFALAELEGAAMKAQVLNVSHAFHSPLMEPILETFEAWARKLNFRSPQIQMISNVSGRFFEPQEIPGPDYWRRHIQHWYGLAVACAPWLKRIAIVIWNWDRTQCFWGWGGSALKRTWRYGCRPCERAATTGNRCSKACQGFTLPGCP